MQEYTTIIGKLLAGVNRKKFNRIVDKYKGNFAAKKLSCWEQFVAIFLGQITGASSLREIVDTIKFHSNQHYHLGIKKDVARSTLALANKSRDWKIYRDLFFDLIKNIKVCRSDLLIRQLIFFVGIVIPTFLNSQILCLKSSNRLFFYNCVENTKAKRGIAVNSWGLISCLGWKFLHHCNTKRGNPFDFRRSEVD